MKNGVENVNYELLLKNLVNAQSRNVVPKLFTAQIVQVNYICIAHSFCFKNLGGSFGKF